MKKGVVEEGRRWRGKKCDRGGRREGKTLGHMH